jgi:hypothetical protein
MGTSQQTPHVQQHKLHFTQLDAIQRTQSSTSAVEMSSNVEPDLSVDRSTMNLWRHCTATVHTGCAYGAPWPLDRQARGRMTLFKSHCWA